MAGRAELEVGAGAEFLDVGAERLAAAADLAIGEGQNGARHQRVRHGQAEALHQPHHRQQRVVELVRQQQVALRSLPT